MVIALKDDGTAMHLNNTMVLPNLYNGIDVDHGNIMVLNCITHYIMVMHNYDKWYKILSNGTIFINCALLYKSMLYNFLYSLLVLKDLSNWEIL